MGEILFGLIMALGFTGAVRLGREEADNHALFVGIFGCNLAWAIVDGVMYVLTQLFERGRKYRVVRDVLKSASDEFSLKRIADEIDGPLIDLTTPQEREQLHRAVLEVVRRSRPEAAKVTREDLLGGLAVGIVIVLATFPIVVPFLVFENPGVAVRVSNLVALAQLFLLGAWWGRMVGAGSLRIAGGLTLVGIVLVLVTILLGG